MRTKLTRENHELAAISLGVESVVTTLHNATYHVDAGHLPAQLDTDDLQRVTEMCRNLCAASKLAAELSIKMGAMPVSVE